MIHLRTLGALELRGRDGRELGAVLSQPKRLALLAHLAITSPLGFQRRDQLLALFWPELDTEHARAALNRAIYYLRRSLGEGVLLSRGDEVIGLSGEAIWCDAAAFQTAVAQGCCPDALELYRGDLLEGFFISDSPDFERWLETERERLRDLAYRTAWTFADQQVAAGKDAVAAYWARWAIDRSPYDEVGVQRLICLLDAMGDRAGAVHAYEQFARRITDGLELEPAPETRALIESVRQRSQPAGSNGWLVKAPGHERTHDVSIEAATEAAPVVEARGSKRRFRWPGTKAAALSAAAALSLASAVLIIAPGHRSTLDVRRVVVAQFQNRTGDPALDRLSPMAAHWLSLSLIETEPVEPVAPATSGGQSCEQTAELRRLARETRAGTVVCGAFYREGGKLRFHAGVLDVLRGTAVWTIPPVSASVDAPQEALRDVLDRVTGAVAALMHPGTASWFHHATAPPTNIAFQEYARGMASDEPKETALHMQHAAALDSTFTWAALNAARILLAYDPPRSDSLMKSLDARRDRLPPLQILGLDGLRARQADNRVAAYDAFSKAASIAPRIFLSDLARSARYLYRPRESLQRLDQYDALIAAEKRRPDGIVRSALLHQLREHRRELAVVRRARRDYPRGLQSLYQEVRTRAAMGQQREVSLLIDTALSYPREKMYSPGNVMMIAATEFRAHGYTAAGTEWLRRTIEWYRANPTAEPNTWLSNVSAALYQAGRLDEAEPLYRRLLDEQPEYAVFHLASLGAIAAQRGDRAGALRFADSLNTLKFPNTLRAYYGKFEQARIKALLGDAEGALQLLREANGPQGLDLHTDFDFESLTNHPGFKEFTRPKG